MSSRIILKNSSEADKVPNPGDLELGEVAINTTDGIMYTKKGDGSVVTVGPSNMNIVKFESSGTYNKPSNLLFCEVTVVSGGGGATVNNISSNFSGGNGKSGIVIIKEYLS